MYVCMYVWMVGWIVSQQTLSFDPDLLGIRSQGIPQQDPGSGDGGQGGGYFFDLPRAELQLPQTVLFLRLSVKGESFPGGHLFPRGEH